MIPTIMCHPLWRNLKARVAKKHLDGVLRDFKFLSTMASTKPGDLIRDCSAFNVRVSKISPLYFAVGGGQVLYDLDIDNDNGGSCSFRHCGVEPAWTRQQIIDDWEQSVQYWRTNGDSFNFAKRYEFTTVDEEGKATVDYLAYQVKYEGDNK